MCEGLLQLHVHLKPHVLPETQKENHLSKFTSHGPWHPQQRAKRSQDLDAWMQGGEGGNTLKPQTHGLRPADCGFPGRIIEPREGSVRCGSGRDASRFWLQQKQNFKGKRSCRSFKDPLQDQLTPTNVYLSSHLMIPTSLNGS